MLSILHERGPVDAHLVPVEATSLLGMVLLEEFGVLTGNVAERPGARVSLRLRPTAEEVACLGGMDAVVEIVDGAMDGATEARSRPRTGSRNHPRRRHEVRMNAPPAKPGQPLPPVLLQLVTPESCCAAQPRVPVLPVTGPTSAALAGP